MCFQEESVIICAASRGNQRLCIKRWKLDNNLSVSFNAFHISCSLYSTLSSFLTKDPLQTNPTTFYFPHSPSLFYIYIYQVIDASRTLVLLDKGATAGSASMTADSTAPPKQKSMELNQQAKGLTLETSRAPAREHTEVHLSARSVMWISLSPLVFSHRVCRGLGTHCSHCCW